MTALITSTPARTTTRFGRRIGRLAVLLVAVAAPAVASSDRASAAVPSNNVFPIAHAGAACNNDFGVPRPGGRTHQGIDCGFAVPIGTPLVAVEAGRIENLTDSPTGCGRGNALKLTGASGTTYYYGHLDRITVASGTVSRGQVIGTLGDTGNANRARCGGGGKHLHFEMRLNGTTVVNPYPYVTQWPKVGGGTPPTTPGDARQPFGRFDALQTRGGGQIGFWGWAADPDTPTRSIDVHVYVTRANGVRTYHPYTANQVRTDIGAAYPGYGNNHGYSAVIAGLPRGSTKVEVYAIDSSGKANDYALIGTRWVTVP